MRHLRRLAHAHAQRAANSAFLFLTTEQVRLVDEDIAAGSLVAFPRRLAADDYLAQRVDLTKALAHVERHFVPVADGDGLGLTHRCAPPGSAAARALGAGCAAAAGAGSAASRSPAARRRWMPPSAH